MMNIRIIRVIWLVALSILPSQVIPTDASGTVVGFYNTFCPLAESLVQLLVQKKFKEDNRIPAALLRMHFHDCFVRGCDASILVDSTPGHPAEKEAGPNASVRGYEFIDQIKSVLEAVCPHNVSCADIIALATRDAVALAGGPHYDVPTGRRDGTHSNEEDADILPSPNESVGEVAKAFALRGLSVLDLVTLLGAHTVGVTHCSFIQDRLYDFNNSGSPDTTMDPILLRDLRKLCPDPSSESTEDPPVALDQGTVSVFDNSYFKQIAANRGILTFDRELYKDSTTTGIVRAYAGLPSANAMDFETLFVPSIIKMGNLGVLTGSQGTIRENCRVVNA